MPSNDDRSQELLALQPSLDAWAMALTHDALEATDLVHDTLAVAGEAACAPAAGESTQAWIHSLLRRRFHSVERARVYSRSRSAAVTALNDANLRTRRARLADERALAG
jgi:DNA-directed RNA polymerase specialized sigma24 family protein